MSVPEVLSPRYDPRSQADERLVRAIGAWGVGATAVNGLVGAGIFVLPGLIAAMLGPAAIVAYVICGFAVLMVQTCFIEIGTVVKRSGGAVAYVEEAFGPLAGFLAWLLYSVGFLVLACAAIGNILVDSAALVLPAIGHGMPRALAFFVLFGGLAAVNVVGVRQGLRFTVATTIAKLLPLLFVIAAGLIAMHWRELQWAAWPSGRSVGEASLLLFFAFQGAETALAPSGEIREPERTIPRGMFGGIGAVILIYIALQVACQGVLGSELSRHSTAPVAAVAGRMVGPIGQTLVLAGVALSILGTLSGAMLAAPRQFFVAAQDGMLPAALAKVHPRFRTPHVAIATFAALIFALSVSGEFSRLAVLSSASILCVYLAVCLGSLRLRYTRERKPGAFRAPGGPTVGILGALAVVWLLSHSTMGQIGELSAAVALAIGYYFGRKQFLLRRTRAS